MIEIKKMTDTSDESPESASAYLTVQTLVLENFDKWTIRQKLAIIRALLEKSEGLGSV